jgi:hypothetical protein
MGVIPTSDTITVKVCHVSLDLKMKHPKRMVYTLDLGLDDEKALKA